MEWKGKQDRGDPQDTRGCWRTGRLMDIKYEGILGVFAFGCEKTLSHEKLEAENSNPAQSHDVGFLLSWNTTQRTCVRTDENSEGRRSNVTQNVCLTKICCLPKNPNDHTCKSESDFGGWGGGLHTHVCGETHSYTRGKAHNGQAQVTVCGLLQL